MKSNTAIYKELRLEYEQLNVKVMRLHWFIETSSIYRAMQNSEQELLDQQRLAMIDYLKVLVERAAQLSLAEEKSRQKDEQLK